MGQQGRPSGIKFHFPLALARAKLSHITNARAKLGSFTAWPAVAVAPVDPFNIILLIHIFAFQNTTITLSLILIMFSANYIFL